MALNTETSFRSNADLQLNTDVSSETSRRVSADTTLMAQLTSEFSARSDADAIFSTALSSESASRINVDAILSSSIVSEASIRFAADMNISNDLLTESSRAKSKEASLSVADSSFVSLSNLSVLSTFVNDQIASATICQTVPLNPLLYGSYAHCAGLTNGVSCIPICNNGYTANSALTCIAGIWSGSSFCIPNPCNAIPGTTPAYGNVSACFNKPNGTKCDPICNVGYSSQSSLVCVLGNWTGSAYCAPLPCPTLNAPSNALLNNSVTPITNGVTATIVQISCSPGYFMIPAVVSCLPSSQWTSISSSCSLVACPPNANNAPSCACVSNYIATLPLTFDTSSQVWRGTCTFNPPGNSASNAATSASSIKSIWPSDNNGGIPPDGTYYLKFASGSNSVFPAYIIFSRADGPWVKSVQYYGGVDVSGSAAINGNAGASWMSNQINLNAGKLISADINSMIAMSPTTLLRATGCPSIGDNLFNNCNGALKIVWGPTRTNWGVDYQPVGVTNAYTLYLDMNNNAQYQYAYKYIGSGQGRCIGGSYPSSSIWISDHQNPMIAGGGVPSGYALPPYGTTTHMLICWTFGSNWVDTNLHAWSGLPVRSGGANYWGGSQWASTAFTIFLSN